MNFTAIDVETANPDRASICQIGIVRYVDGRLVERWSSLIDPGEYFDDWNIYVHGIEERHVRGKPKLPDVADKLGGLLNNTICVSHGSFDRIAIDRAFDKYRLTEINSDWLDTQQVVRRIWDEFSQRGYGLDNVCKKIGYHFKHHDALEDAKACAKVLLAATEESGLSIGEWLDRLKKPNKRLKHSSQPGVKREGNPAGSMYGDVIVFTGALDISRAEGADLAAEIGCDVHERVTKKTTILVVGDRDVNRFDGKEKSVKHINAEGLIEKGQDIEIIVESDFKKLAKY
ncbi:MAG: exonuclease domain-containing protein [bacterium]